MHTTELSLKSLHLLSPGLAADFQEKLEAAVRDCQQRPGQAQKRTVKIELAITPNKEDVDDVDILPVTTSTTPARKLDIIRARRTARHQLQFDFVEDDM